MGSRRLTDILASHFRLPNPYSLIPIAIEV